MSERVRWSFALAALLAAASAQAQASAQPPGPPAQQPPPGPGSQSTAGSQGQSSTAQPSSPGASSQQVVVNPPQPVPPAAPPSSTTVVNPPPPSSAGTTVVTPPYGDAMVIERQREKPNLLGTVAMDAAYGGVAGLLVGGGVALVEQGDNWGRDIMVGAGLGLILGAAVGVVHAVYDQQQYDRATRRAAAGGPSPAALARDGLGRTDRDPVVTARTVGLTFGF